MNFFLFVITVLILANTSYADDRRFTFTYESSTLSKNQKDMEVWTTYKGGREYFYSAFENRLEYEVGLTNKLQTAFYLNFKNVTQAADSSNEYETEFEWEGISTELKYQLLNKYRDGIGFSPYLEFGFNTAEVEVESKLIFDTQISKEFLIAFNVVGEYEWEFNPSPESTSKEFKLEFDLGLAYDITSDFSVGIEARNISEFPNGEDIEYSSLFLGPNMSYRTENWFFAMTYLPQIPAIKNSDDSANSKLVLDSQERNNVRMILGFTL